MAAPAKKKGEVMAIETNKVLEQVMAPVAKVQETIRTAAEKGLTDIRGQYESIKSVTEGNTKAVGASLEVVAKGVSEINAKALAAFQANTSAAFDFATALFAVKTPSEALEVQTAHARKQMEAITAQSKDLASLVQKIGTTAAESLKTIKAPVSLGAK